MSEKIIPKNYGSIAHLSTSKLTQQADKKVSPGQEYILTKRRRDKKDLIIVTEKIDGSNVGVVNKNGYLVPITRAGYAAIDSPHKQHNFFDDWVNANINMFNFLNKGWRISGEWCIKPHGTLYYDISEESPFVAFDIFNDKNERILYKEFSFICSENGIKTVPILHIGDSISIEDCISLMGNGHYGKSDKPEGFVYRVERNGKVDFLAKWVRSDKIDGRYMKMNLWNYGFHKHLNSFEQEERNE